MPGALYLLILLRLRIIANFFRYITIETAYKLIFFVILGALFVAADYSFFYRIIDYLKGEEIIGPLLITQLLDMMALTFFFMLFFSTIVAAISTMYLSRDLVLLISSPVSVTAVFVAKFIQTTINSSWMVFLFGVPMFSALGSVYGAGVSYNIKMLLLLLPFVAIPGGLGVLFTVSLIRFFPAKRMQQAVTFLMVLFVAGVVMLFRFMRPEVLYTAPGVADNMLMSFFEKMSVPRSPWLPSAWLTEGFISLTGDGGSGFEAPLTYLSICAGSIFSIVTIVAGRVYLSGLSEAATTSARGREMGRDFIDTTVNILPIGAHHKAFLTKDIKLFFRDTGQWSQLFILGALVIVYIFNIKNLPLETYYLKNLIAFLNLGLAGFVLASVAIRFVFPSVSLEGEAIWVIRRSPVSVKGFLWVKYFTFLLPLLLLGEILMIGSNLLLEVDSFMMMLSTSSILLITLGITGLGVGMGAMYPKFRYDNIAEVAAGAGGIIYMILCLGYIGAVILLEARPVYVHFKRQILLVDYSMTSLYVALALILIMTAGAIIIPMRKGIKALESMDL